MTTEQLASEQDRFNALSAEEAQRIWDEADQQPACMRSCWYCNSAHEHLKDISFVCFACGIPYLKGYPAPIVNLRRQNTKIPDQVMQQFAEALKAADDDE